MNCQLFLKQIFQDEEQAPVESEQPKRAKVRHKLSYYMCSSFCHL